MDSAKNRNLVFNQVVAGTLFQFQIKDDIKAARKEATEAYRQYVEEPSTSQLRERFELELELLGFCTNGKRGASKMALFAFGENLL